MVNRRVAGYKIKENMHSPAMRRLNQFWFKGMRESNDEICPDSPLKTSDGGVFQSMLDEQIITGVAKSNAGNKSSITTLLVKQFAWSLGDDGKKIIAEIDGGLAVPGGFSRGGKNAAPDGGYYAVLAGVWM